MERISEGKNWAVLLLCVFSTGFISCDSGDDSDENAETKQRLVGEWRLVSRAIEGAAVGTEELSHLEESTATFNTDNTYVITYRRSDGSSSSTSVLSGIYTVTGVNSIAFLDSMSEVELVEEALQITSSTEDNRTQVDVFLRGDHQIFRENDNGGVIDLGEDNNPNPSVPSYDGSTVIAQIQGVWAITNISDECQRRNTLEFMGPDAVVFTQHKSTFNRDDLRRYGVSVNLPLQSDYSGVVTVGFNTISLDSNADCQLVKESRLTYLVKDSETITINESSRLTIRVIDSNTINLIYDNGGGDSNQEIFVYTRT